jgi:hypothetical protein
MAGADTSVCGQINFNCHLIGANQKLEQEGEIRRLDMTTMHPFV